MTRKTVYTLNVASKEAGFPNGYDPRITAITYPLMQRYAERIGAEFVVIGTRKKPDWPCCIEKLQIYDLARERGDDWSLFFDSDTLIHPECIDFTCMLPRDTAAHNGIDFANIRSDYDEYFLRDGRNIGCCNWLAIASSWCRDLWHPPTLTLDETLARIHPTVEEQRCGITKRHLVDDFTLSRNVARFGLKMTTLLQLFPKIGLEGANFFFHEYTIPPDEKLQRMCDTVERWHIEKFIPADALKVKLPPTKK
jgi:hypothetical protein